MQRNNLTVHKPCVYVISSYKKRTSRPTTGFTLVKNARGITCRPTSDWSMSFQPSWSNLFLQMKILQITAEDKWNNSRILTCSPTFQTAAISLREEHAFFRKSVVSSQQMCGRGPRKQRKLCKNVPHIHTEMV